MGVTDGEADAVEVVELVADRDAVPDSVVEGALLDVLENDDVRVLVTVGDGVAVNESETEKVPVGVADVVVVGE